jgi:hypothetical protein
MQRFGACVVTVPLDWAGMCNIFIIIIIKHGVSCTVVCLFNRVLAPITSTLRPVSLQQPRATSQVQLLLASVESHVLLSSIILPPSTYRVPRNELHHMLAWILFVSCQYIRLRRGFNCGQFRLDPLSRWLLLQCSKLATIEMLYGRCQQVMLSNGHKEWPVTCRFCQ